jgi:hypothetical protein
MNEPLPQPAGPTPVHPAIVEEAIQRATREAVLAQAHAGQPVAAWRDGRVVWLRPAEVVARLSGQPPRAQA